MPELESTANKSLLSSMTVCKMEYVTRPLSPLSRSVAVSSLKFESTTVREGTESIRYWVVSRGARLLHVTLREDSAINVDNLSG